MGRVPSAAEIPVVGAKLGTGKSGGDAECPGEFWRGTAEDRTTNALMGDIVAGMWRTGSCNWLDPGAIPDTPPAAPDVSTSAFRLARQQGLKISWQQASPKVPGTSTWTGYEAYKHTTTTESAKMCGCTTGDLPYA